MWISMIWSNIMRPNGSNFEAPLHKTLSHTIYVASRNYAVLYCVWGDRPLRSWILKTISDSNSNLRHAEVPRVFITKKAISPMYLLILYTGLNNHQTLIIVIKSEFESISGKTGWKSMMCSRKKGFLHIWMEFHNYRTKQRLWRRGL